MVTIFGYNSTTLDPEYQKFTSSTPALGYTLLYGPMVSSANENDIAIFDFNRRQGFRNLLITGSWIEGSGDMDSQPTTGTYDGTLQYYNVLNGYHPRPISPPYPFHNPTTGAPTRFTQTGDPVNATGWLDANPGDRNITFTSGNFDMAQRDTQEVIIIMTAGLGADRSASIDSMKFFARKACEFAQYNFVSKVSAHEKSNRPGSFLLFQNYPNPFNQGTKIRYAISEDGPTTLKIYNLTGRLVRELVNETQSQGSHEIVWDGKDTRGQVVASGIYFYQLKSGRQATVRRMVLLQ
jgi:hypothetical protein